MRKHPPIYYVIRSIVRFAFAFILIFGFVVLLPALVEAYL